MQQVQLSFAYVTLYPYYIGYLYLARSGSILMQLRVIGWIKALASSDRHVRDEAVHGLLMIVLDPKIDLEIEKNA